MHVLITGGAGFIGCNLADRLLGQNLSVTLFDNLSRPGTPENIAWLRERHGDRVRLVQEDIRDPAAVSKAVSHADVVYHLAAQTAVTTSVANPRHDFEVNAAGTLNVLEAARVMSSQPIVIYASTNKVYGAMEQVPILEQRTRYAYCDGFEGVGEEQSLDFHSPYGCSKGAADQYVRDYARIYGLRTVVLRQSCIYGPRQLGVEDQGWVAWFVIAAVMGRPITIYGDGKQVRDLLHVEDLLDLYEVAVRQIGLASGQVYNVGGGSRNAIAIWSEFGPLLEEFLGRPIAVRFADLRPGDQRIFVSSNKKAADELGWVPRRGLREGIKELVAWVQNNRIIFSE